MGVVCLGTLDPEGKSEIPDSPAELPADPLAGKVALCRP